MAFDLKKALLGESASDRLKQVKRKVKEGVEMNFALMPAQNSGPPILIYSKNPLSVDKAAAQGKILRNGEQVLLTAKKGNLTDKLLLDLNKATRKLSIQGVEFVNGKLEGPAIDDGDDDATPKPPPHVKPTQKMAHLQNDDDDGGEDPDAAAYAKTPSAYGKAPAGDEPQYAKTPGAPKPPPRVKPTQKMAHLQNDDDDGGEDPDAAAYARVPASLDASGLRAAHKLAVKQAAVLRKVAEISEEADNDRAYLAKWPGFCKAIDGVINGIETLQPLKPSGFGDVSEVAALFRYMFKTEALSPEKQGWASILGGLDALDGDLGTVESWLKKQKT